MPPKSPLAKGTAVPPKSSSATARKPRALPAHPPYNEMVVKAINATKERGAASRQKILKYIRSNFKVSEGFETHVKLALKRGVTNGVLVQPKGTGASGSFKVAKPTPSAKPAKPVKKVTTSKPKRPATKKPVVAKKTTVKKQTTAKKPKAPKKVTAGKKTSVKKQTTKTKKSKAKSTPKKQTGAKKTAKKAVKSPKK